MSVGASPREGRPFPDARRGQDREAGHTRYAVVRLVARAALRAIHRLKVTSPAAVPWSGPLVIVANHESAIDGAVLAAAFPARRLTFLSASYLFDQPLTGTFLRAMGALPVQIDGRNLASLKQAMAILRRGGAVAVFPEGGIARSEALGGAAYLALKTDTPILPVRLKGTCEALPPGRVVPRPHPIEVALGTPFYLSRAADGPAAIRRAVSDGTVVLECMLHHMRSTQADEGAVPIVQTSAETTWPAQG